MVSEGHHTLCPPSGHAFAIVHSLCAIQIEKTSDKLVPKVQQWRLNLPINKVFDKKSYEIIS